MDFNVFQEERNTGNGRIFQFPEVQQQFSTPFT